MKTFNKLLGTLIPLALISGCSGGGDGDAPAGTLEPTLDAENKVIFRPFVRNLPFPTNLFFSGTTDATVNITVGLDSPVVQTLNDIDGYSTIAPATFNLGEAADPATISASVHVFHLCADATGSKAPIQPGADGKLVEGVDYSVAASALAGNDTQIVVKPLKPLRPMFDSATTAGSACANAAGAAGAVASNAYSIVVTNSLQTADDNTAFQADDTYVLAKSTERYLKLDSDPDFDNSNPQNNVTPEGAALGLDLTTLGQLESIRRLTNGLEQLAALMSANAVNPVNAIMSFNFSTQSIGVTLGAVAGLASAGANSIGPAPKPGGAPGIRNTGEVGLPLPPVADIYEGTISIPYYQQIPSAGNPTAALTGRWLANPATAPDGSSSNLTFANATPVKQGDLNIPVIITVPNAAAAMANPACAPLVNGMAPFPTVIFQHGITRNRTDVFAIAPAFAANACTAMIAIDIPLHGITDDTSPFFAGAAERTFNMDLVTENANPDIPPTPGPDGITDSSGTHFINLSNLINSRDNTRQGIADLLTLAVSISGINLNDPSGNLSLNGDDVGFVGHSLGGIIGGSFMGVANQFDAQLAAAMQPAKFGLDAVSLAKSGGGIGKLLDASGSFGPRIRNGLAAAGVAEGSANFESFIRAAQTAVDSADPLNWAKARGALPGALQTPVHVIEVVGGSGMFDLPDTVVPNDAFNPAATDDSIPEPGLGGTTPLAVELELGGNTVEFDSAGAGTMVAGSSRVQFLCGNHGTILNPALSDADGNTVDADFYLAVTQEMQGEVVQFIAGDGAGFTVSAGTCPSGPPTP